MRIRPVLNAVWIGLFFFAAFGGLPVLAGEEGADPPEGYVEVELELPQPTFAGTPLNYWSEILEISYRKRDPFYAPEGTENLALGKPVTSSDKQPLFGKLEMVTDGKKEALDDNLLELRGGPQYVQIDLGEPAEIHGVLAWHFFAYERVYHDVIVQLADDKDFTKNVRTIFNNDHDNSSGLGVGKDKEYIEGYEGRLFTADGEVARFVRLWSNGNSSDDMNHYIEVEVYGTPVQ